MPVIKMLIRDMLLDEWKFNYGNCNNLEERELRNLISKLVLLEKEERRKTGKLIQENIQPEFYVYHKSKMT